MLKNILIFAVVIIILIAISYFSISTLTSARNQKIADIKGHRISLEIADDETEQRKGLSARDSLPKDKGMLFKFKKADTHTFWMKDMRFPIDIIFINNDKIVTIHHNVPAFMDTNKTPNLTIYAPKSPADKVIEINAGLAKEYEIKEGDTIKINP